MSKTLRWVSIFGIIVVYVACAPVNFGANNEPPDGFANLCVSTPSACAYDYKITIGGPKVDILFVNDNSASMSFEQKALAARFDGFIQNLDSKKVDYRIAITTTDIQDNTNEPRTINGNGNLQNGKLISFGTGTTYLT